MDVSRVLQYKGLDVYMAISTWERWFHTDNWATLWNPDILYKDDLVSIEKARSYSAISQIVGNISIGNNC